MKASKIIGGLISVVSIIGMVAFALGIQSMFSVIQTGIPGAGGSLEMDPTEPIIIPLTPTNQGFLDATLSVSVEFVLDGETVASDEFSLTIPARSQIPTELQLVIPPTALLDTGPDTVFEVITDIHVTSLFDTISFDNTMTITGGAA